jgi:TPR repeat protein
LYSLNITSVLQGISLDYDTLATLENAIAAYNDGNHKDAYIGFDSLSIHDDESQYYLGLMYFNGHYVEKDLEMALYWWKKSAKSRNEDAIFQLESLSMTRNTRY